MGILVCLCHAARTSGQEEDRSPAEAQTERLEILRDAAEKALERRKIGTEAEIEVDQYELRITYRKRTYMVYSRDRLGRWSEELRPAVGPRNDGFVIGVSIADGPYGGAWRRLEVTPLNYALGTTARAPYYTIHGSYTSLDKLDAHMAVTIFVGEHTDRQLVIALHKALLDAAVERGWLDLSKVPARPGARVLWEKADAFRSDDPQARCDAFYELFSRRKPRDRSFVLYGKTTHEIHEPLGPPTEVTKLDHEGVRWLQITYRFEECPSAAPAESRRAWKNGWRFSALFHFRDGICVPFDRVARETGLMVYPSPPERLRFKPGGAFP